MFGINNLEKLKANSFAGPVYRIPVIYLDFLAEKNKYPERFGGVTLDSKNDGKCYAEVSIKDAHQSEKVARYIFQTCRDSRIC